MMKFEKYDEIDHPKFGKGVVKKVTKVNKDLSFLEVDFKERDEKKQLSSQWVEKNCICSSALSESEYEKKYVEVQVECKPVWKVFLRKDIRFTNVLKEKIEYVLGNTVPGIAFAIIGPNSLIGIMENEYKGFKSVEKIARKSMRSIFGFHPDFSTYPMDDGGLIICMLDGRVLHFLTPGEIDTQNGNESPMSAFYARGELMERCEIGDILGIITGFEEEEEL